MARVPAWTISVGAALLITLIFAPWSLYGLSLIALALVFASWLQQTARTAWWLGALFGLVYALNSSYWVYYSLHDFGEASVFFAISTTALLVIFIALFYAFVAYVVARCHDQPRWSVCLLIFPALWVLMEWLRTNIWTGFPWNLLGQSLVESPWQGVLPLFGVLGGSAVIALCAGSIVYFFHAQLNRKWISVLVLSLVLASVWSLKDIHWTQETSEKLSVTIIQANIPQKIKFDRAYFEALMAKYSQLSEHHLDSDLIIWPETAIPVYADLVEPWLAPLNEKIAAEDSELMTGIFYRNKDAGIYHNSLMNATRGEFYHKRRLVPFGEYLPLRPMLELFGKFIIIPMSDLEPSHGKPIISTAGYAAGASICYEAAFSNDVADALPEADFLINVSNDSWFGDSLAPHQMLQMAQLRSAETERSMVRATNTGISAIIDHRGHIVADSQLFETSVLRAEVAMRRGATPYVRWRDHPLLVWITISLGVAGWVGWRAKNKSVKWIR